MKSAALAALYLLFVCSYAVAAKGHRVAAGVVVLRETSKVASLPGGGFPAFGLVAAARRYVGSNPTGMRRAWCGRFMRTALASAGHGDPGPEYDAAFAYRKLGHRGAPGPGAIVYWGHHVGVIVEVTGPGRAVVISGNDGPAGGRRVLERERSLAGAQGYRYP